MSAAGDSHTKLIYWLWSTDFYNLEQKISYKLSVRTCKLHMYNTRVATCAPARKSQLTQATHKTVGTILLAIARSPSLATHGARAATTAVVCFGAARVRSINWPARNTWRRTATPWNTTSTRRREWSPACNTHGRRCKHSCFSSSRRSAAWAFSEQPRLLARRGARRSRSCARGGGTCPCAPTH